MAGTRIVAGRAVGSRTGLRRDLGSVTTRTRYDLYRGNEYVRSEDRVSGMLTSDDVPTEFAVVEAGGSHHEFDVRSLAPDAGEGIHVLTHRIGFGTVVDLYQDRLGMIVSRGNEDPGEPGILAVALVAIMVAGAVHLLGHDAPSTFAWGVAAGVAAHMLGLGRRIYVVRGVAVLRWRAERSLKRTRR